MSRAQTVYEFGDFTLHAGAQRLVRRGSGNAIPLTGKVFDTLLYLVEHAGDTLDKDELLKAIWPGVIVEENSLTQNISTLRQVLGETRGENRYIATVSRRGYRFVAQVTTRRDEETPPQHDAAPPYQSAKRNRVNRWAIGTVGLLAALAAAFIFIPTQKPARAGQTLAILPFKPLVPAERNESLELGMTETLISSLGQNSPQTIPPLSSVRRFAALDQDAVAAGRELRVDTVLDGSLQRHGDRLRVSARLLRVSDGRQLWAQNFDQEFTTIFDVQDTIAAKVAQAVSLRWTENEAPHGAPYTKDPEAYALYASGRFSWTLQTEPSLLQSIDFYERAIARDPNYALAYAGLADSYAILGVFGMRAPGDVFPKARVAVEKALTIDPNLPTAITALGHIKVQYEHDWDGGLRDYTRSLQLDPALATTYHRLGLLYAMQGDFERAIAEVQKAQAIEPLWLAMKSVPANFHFYARHYDEAMRIVEQTLALDERAANARGFRVRILIAQGQYERAIAELDKAPLQTPGSNAFRAEALALSGRREEALTELARLLEASKTRYVGALDIALIYAALEDKENAFAWLNRAIEDRSTLLGFLAQDPMFDGLHSDPRFAALVQKVGIYGRVLPKE